MGDAVQAAEAVPQDLRELLVGARVRGREVEGHQRRLRAARRLDRVVRGFELRLLAAEQRDGGAMAGARERDGTSQPLARARDEDHAIGEEVRRRVVRRRDRERIRRIAHVVTASRAPMCRMSAHAASWPLRTALSSVAGYVLAV
jgi:hypothetical protein